MCLPIKAQLRSYLRTWKWSWIARISTSNVRSSRLVQVYEAITPSSLCSKTLPRLSWELMSIPNWATLWEWLRMANSSQRYSKMVSTLRTRTRVKLLLISHSRKGWTTLPIVQVPSISCPQVAQWLQMRFTIVAAVKSWVLRGKKKERLVKTPPAKSSWTPPFLKTPSKERKSCAVTRVKKLTTMRILWQCYLQFSMSNRSITMNTCKS